MIDEFVLSLFFLNYFFYHFFLQKFAKPSLSEKIKKMLRFVLTEEELQSCAQSHC